MTAAAATPGLAAGGTGGPEVPRAELDALTDGLMEFAEAVVPGGGRVTICCARR